MKRKLLSLLLSLAMLATTCALAETAPTPDPLPYRSDFSTSADGWYARSAGSATGTVEDGTFVIRGREATWNSPGRDFHLAPGTEHRITVEVMQNEEASTKFILSVAKTTGGNTTYQNLATLAAPKGEWTTLVADYTPAACDVSTLYVETSGSGTVSYAIRNFTVSLKNGHYDMTLPSLKAKYADKFIFGAAVTQSEARSNSTMDFYATQFGIFTHGNELKPDFVLDLAACREAAKTDDTAVAVHFDSALPLLNYCRDHDLKVHGHVLVWHSQTPEAFFHEGYDVSKPLVTREVMLARMESYIRQVLAFVNETYPGVVVSWDVVNEACDDSTGTLRESLWTKVVGQDFVNRAFEYAHKYAPEDVLLCYNDYNTYFEPKLTAICNLVDSLIADGTIDAYGFQMHMDATNPSDEQLKTAIAALASRNIKLRVSELDVGIPDTSEKQLYAQAKRYEDLLQMLEPYTDQLVAVHTWGISDHLSWRAEKHPLLFDINDAPKPAFWALCDPASLPPYVEKTEAIGPGDETLLDSAPQTKCNGFRFWAVYTADNALLVKVHAQDGTVNPEDGITVYAADQVQQIMRTTEGVTKTPPGYTYVFRFEGLDLTQGSVPFDVMVNNKGVLTSWSDPANAETDRLLGQLLLVSAE